MNEERGIAVLGAGGHAKVVVGALQAAGETVAAVFDEDQSKWGGALLGAPIVGGIDRIGALGLLRAVLAIGDNRARQRLAAELDLDWITVVHPSAWIHADAELEGGSVVFAGAVIQPGAAVGAHCIVNTRASLDHDCRLGDFAHVAPGACLAGGVTVGEGALVGIGSCVIPGVHVGAWSTIGAGAAVVRDVSDGATVTGVPAR